MALRSRTIRGALVKRVRRMGMHEAVGVLGPAREPNSVIDRSFSVSIQGDSHESGDRAPSEGLMRKRVAFIVTIAHRLEPGDGPSSMDQMLDDRDDVVAVVMNGRDDEIREAQHTIEYTGTQPPVLAGGGAYVLQYIGFTMTYLQDLSLAPASEETEAPS